MGTMRRLSHQFLITHSSPKGIQMTDFLGPVRSRVLYGFVAAGGDPRTAVVALRGTVGAAEWWDDLHWDLVSFTPVPDGGMVARGFSDIYGTYGTMTPGQPQGARASATFAADVAHAAASGLGAGLDPALPAVVWACRTVALSTLPVE